MACWATEVIPRHSGGVEDIHQYPGGDRLKLALGFIVNFIIASLDEGSNCCRSGKVATFILIHAGNAPREAVGAPLSKGHR